MRLKIINCRAKVTASRGIFFLMRSPLGFAPEFRPSIIRFYSGPQSSRIMMFIFPSLGTGCLSTGRRPSYVCEIYESYSRTRALKRLTFRLLVSRGHRIALHYVRDSTAAQVHLRYVFSVSKNDGVSNSKRNAPR